MSQQYDVAVIGGGPGGYVAAIKAAQLGLKTVCIEKRGALGGTCLNVGCIPSKTLLHISHLFEQSAHEFADLGINTPSPSVDLEKVQAKKDSVTEGLTQGIEQLFKKNKVDYVKGHAAFFSKDTLEVTLNDGGKSSISAKNIIIATGSSVSSLPGIDISGKRVISSDHAIHLKDAPKTLAVLGGGVIGCELGSVWRRFGSDVTVIEYAGAIVPTMDGEVSKEAKKLFEKQGLNIRTSTKCTSVEENEGGVKLTLEPAQGGSAETFEADMLLVCVGRKPNTEGLGLQHAGVSTTDRGVIITDDKYRTNVANIYAIGDVTDGPMLAHKAEEDGVAAVEIIAGQAGGKHYDLVPAVVYTHPEIAAIGKTEEQLKEAGVAYNKGKFPFFANSRARTMDDSAGFVKILADKKTDEILGAHIIGPQAGTLIGELSVGMAFKAASEDIARICHSHPDLNEAIKEAAMDTYGKPIHK